MLDVSDLRAGYSEIDALKGLSFTVADREIVALIGANGAGKTTTLSTISGLLRPRRGQINWQGRSLIGLKAEEVVRLGVAHCPEGRRIFPGLTVMENLLTGAASRPKSEKLDDSLDLIFELFPRLAERKRQGGWSLSGGEQQMLAMGRALMSRPQLLMLDEPSLGLAPILVEQMFDRILELNRRTGLTILLVEQNSTMALEVSHRAYVMETGTISVSGASAELAADPRVQEAYLGG